MKLELVWFSRYFGRLVASAPQGCCTMDRRGVWVPWESHGSPTMDFGSPTMDFESPSLSPRIFLGLAMVVELLNPGLHFQGFCLGLPRDSQTRARPQGVHKWSRSSQFARRCRSTCILFRNEGKDNWTRRKQCLRLRTQIWPVRPSHPPPHHTLPKRAVAFPRNSTCEIMRESELSRYHIGKRTESMFL